MAAGIDKRIWYAIGGVVVIVLAFQMFRGTGPMDLGTAKRLAEYKLGGEQYRLEVVTSAGEVAMAPPASLKQIAVIGCPKIGSSAGNLQGRYGQGNRTHATAAFECLFSSQVGTGKVYFAGHVWRSADPDYRGEVQGHILTFQKQAKVRQLMSTLKVATRPLSPAEREKVQEALKGEGVTPMRKVDFGATIRRRNGKD